MAKRYVGTGEAADYLGITRQTLQRWVKDGLVRPAFRTPRRGDMRWNLDDIDQQLSSTPPTQRTWPAKAEQLALPIAPVPDPSKPQQPAVIAAVVTSRLGVLAGKRRDNLPPWTLIAGKSQPGESPADTLTREVKEETGLLVRPGATIGQRVHPQTGRLLVYVAAIPATRNREIFVGDDIELAEVAWLTLEDVDQLMPDMFAPVRQHLQRVMTGPAAKRRAS